MINRIKSATKMGKKKKSKAPRASATESSEVATGSQAPDEEEDISQLPSTPKSDSKGVQEGNLIDVSTPKSTSSKDVGHLIDLSTPVVATTSGPAAASSKEEGNLIDVSTPKASTIAPNDAIKTQAESLIDIGSLPVAPTGSSDVVTTKTGDLSPHPLPAVSDPIANAAPSAENNEKPIVQAESVKANDESATSVKMPSEDIGKSGQPDDLLGSDVVVEGSTRSTESSAPVESKRSTPAVASKPWKFPLTEEPTPPGSPGSVHSPEVERDTKSSPIGKLALGIDDDDVVERRDESNVPAAIKTAEGISPKSVSFSDLVTVRNLDQDADDIEAQKPWAASFDDETPSKGEPFHDVAFSSDAPLDSKSFSKATSKKLSSAFEQQHSPNRANSSETLQNAQERTTLLGNTEKPKASKLSLGAKKVTSAKVTAVTDEEEGLNETVDEAPLSHSTSGNGSPSKQSVCARRPWLVCITLFIVSLLIARGVGKSSNTSLSTQTQEDRENPVKQAADDNVRRLNDQLSSRPKPVILSTMGSNGEGIKTVTAVLTKPGMQIPDKVNFNGVNIGIKDGTTVKAGFKRVLDSALTPENGITFDEPSVATSASLVEWHVGRAFVAGYINATIHSIPEDKKGERWAFAHPRAGYLLPYYRSIFGGGADNFVFVHIVKNGRSVASRVYEEFRHMCESLRFASYCTDTPENRLAFWAGVNQEAYDWANLRMDVDHYIVVRAEDFTEGNEKCIARVAKDLGLHYTDEQFAEAVEAGKTSKEKLEGSDEVSPDKMTEILEGLPNVRKQFEFWGYDPEDATKMADCDKQAWFK